MTDDKSHMITYAYVCNYVYIMYIHTYTYIHTYMHAYIHTYKHTYIHTSIHPYIHTSIHYIHASMHAYIHLFACIKKETTKCTSIKQITCRRHAKGLYNPRISRPSQAKGNMAFVEELDDPTCWGYLPAHGRKMEGLRR